MKKTYLLFFFCIISFYAHAQTCSGDPDGGFTTLSSTYVCHSGSVTIADSAYTVASGISLQWQTSADSVVWTDIAGATDNTYTASGLTSTTWFRCAVKCTTSGSVAYSLPGMPVFADTLHASFSNDLTYPCYPPEFATFTSTTPGAVSLEWIVDSAATSSYDPLFMSFVFPGIYTITLAVSDTFGCNDTASFVYHFMAGYATASISVAPATCYDSGATINITGTPYSTIFYKIGSDTTTITGTIDSTGNFATVTGPLTANTTFTLTKIASDSGCTYLLDSTASTTVIDLTSLSVYSNSPVCSGDTLIMEAGDSTIGVSYTWIGPGAFYSAMDTLIIPAFTEVSMGVYTLTVTYGSCSISDTLNIVAEDIPTISVSAAAGLCSLADTLMLTTDAVGYSWSPSAGLSCTSCAITEAEPMTTTMYYVTGIGSDGCAARDSVMVNGNKISGAISSSGAPPDTLDCKVWLIRYDSLAMALYAADSSISCVNDGHVYFTFDNEPPGYYLIKAKLLYGDGAGDSGYIPSYAYNSLYWDSAYAFVHAFGNDTGINIAMQYGIVPSGAGFIGGSISMGAGKGTSGTVPAAGTMVYLRNSSGVLNYIYTDVDGNYSFSGLAAGSYDIYPEELNYATIPSAEISITASSHDTGINFYKDNAAQTITPTALKIPAITTLGNSIYYYPNPVKDKLVIEINAQGTAPISVSVENLTGQQVIDYTMYGPTGTVDMSGLPNGVYFVNVTNHLYSYSNEILVQH